MQCAFLDLFAVLHAFRVHILQRTVRSIEEQLEGVCWGLYSICVLLKSYISKTMPRSHQYQSRKTKVTLERNFLLIGSSIPHFGQSQPNSKAQSLCCSVNKCETLTYHYFQQYLFFVYWALFIAMIFAVFVNCQLFVKIKNHLICNYLNNSTMSDVCDYFFLYCAPLNTLLQSKVKLWYNIENLIQKFF